MPREERQRVELRGSQQPRNVVNHANCAERRAVDRAHGYARVEPNAWIAGHERIVGEPRISVRVLHDHRPGLRKGVGAERVLARRLGYAETNTRLEPLAIVVDESHQGNRRSADGGGESRQIVELWLRRRIEYSRTANSLETRRLIRWNGRRAHRA